MFMGPAGKETLFTPLQVHFCKLKPAVGLLCYAPFHILSASALA